MSGSMQSNAGNSQIYQANEQRAAPGADQKPRFHEGNENAHSETDSKDQRSLANRLAAAEADEVDNTSNKQKNTIEDPLKPARMHGNEPSKGAKVDAEIKAEEEKELERKGRI